MIMYIPPTSFTPHQAVSGTTSQTINTRTFLLGFGLPRFFHLLVVFAAMAAMLYLVPTMQLVLDGIRSGGPPSSSGGIYPIAWRGNSLRGARASIQLINRSSGHRREVGILRPLM